MPMQVLLLTIIGFMLAFGMVAGQRFTMVFEQATEK